MNPVAQGLPLHRVLRCRFCARLAVQQHGQRQKSSRDLRVLGLGRQMTRFLRRAIQIGDGDQLAYPSSPHHESS
jgi:hypothetical protein